MAKFPNDPDSSDPEFKVRVDKKEGGVAKKDQPDIDDSDGSGRPEDPSIGRLKHAINTVTDWVRNAVGLSGRKPLSDENPDDLHPKAITMRMIELLSVGAVAKNLQWLRSLLSVENKSFVETLRTATNDHVGVVNYPIGREQLGRLITMADLAFGILKDTDNWSRNTPADDKFRVMGGGAFTALPGEQEWRESRKRLLTLLSFSKNPQLVDIISEAADEFADKLEEKRDKGELNVDIYPLALNYAYRIIAEIVLGKDNSDLASELKEVWQVINSEGGAWIIDAKPYDKIPEVLQEAINKTNEIAQRALEREADRRSNGPDKESIEENTLIAQLWKENLPPEKVASEMRGAMLAGHVTVTVAVGWMLTHLAIASHFRRDVYDELSNMDTPRDLPLGKKLTDRQEVLPYTTAAIQETLRLSPPAPIFGRGNKKSVLSMWEVLG